MERAEAAGFGGGHEGAREQRPRRRGLRRFLLQANAHGCRLTRVGLRQGDRVQHAVRGEAERRRRGVRAVRATVHHGARGTSHTRAHDGDADHERAGQRVQSRGSGGTDVRHDPEGLGEASGRFREHPERQGPDHNHHGQHVVRVPQVLRVEQQHGAAHPPRGPQGFAPLLPRIAQVARDALRRARRRPRGVAPQRPLFTRQDVRAVGVPEKLPGASAGGRMRRAGHGISASAPGHVAQRREAGARRRLRPRGREGIARVGGTAGSRRSPARDVRGGPRGPHTQQRRGAEAVGHPEE
mmetsp:Transcript_14422/g.56902  ORF Transcript_14422/g.56902 Transcript_14422/m.56902 type:complete len:297 (+) Transcript_14422:1928-2818(+)